MQYITEHNIFIFLVQILLLLGLARGLGELFRKWKQPPLTAEVIVGIFLGPTVFGRFLPALYGKVFPADMIQQNMLETIAWLGVLFFLLEIGLEFDFSSAWRQRGDALKIALTDIAIPIAISFTAAMFLPDRYLVDPGQRTIFAVFMATVMTISAMPVAARVLHDLKLTKTDLGFLIVSALSVNDIIGWLVFTIVLGLFMHAAVDVSRIIIIIASISGFAFICLTAGRNMVNYVLSKFKANSGSQPANSLTFICLLGLICGAITQKIGIHALFGFFIAGAMAGGARALSERTRQVISQIVFAVFVPIFFASIGLKIDFLKSFDLFIVLFVTIISMAGKFIGAWLGVGLTGVPRTNRLAIAIAHTPGGMMEILVGLLAFEYKLISEPVFVGILCGAVISSVTLGPWLNYAIRKRKEVSVLEYFSSSAIIADLESTDRDRAIEELSGLASEQEEMPLFEELNSAVLKRENEMGTAIEEGLAVPHARIKMSRRPLVIFGRSISGIEWNSPDGKPTNFIFLIFTPEGDDVQVQILGLIAKTMASKETRDEIMAAKGPGEIWSILERALTAEHITRN